MTYEYFEENLDNLYEAFKGIKFIPVQIDHGYSIRGMKFLGTSPEFKEVGEGLEAPIYTIVTTHIGNKITYGVM